MNAKAWCDDCRAWYPEGAVHAWPIPRTGDYRPQRRVRWEPEPDVEGSDR